ncbi:CS4 pilus chaperone CsaA, partial [Escherichia coli]|nr:CS4 pilus chaperone CsaA [Escherichia coli]
YNNGNVRAGVKDIYFCKSSNIDDSCVKKTHNKNIYPEKSFDTLVNNNFSYVFIKLNHEDIEKEQGLIQLKVP